MPIVICDACQSRYSLKAEHAGRKVRCKTCEAVLVVPEEDGFEVDRPDRGYHPSFDRDRFFVNQKRISIDEKYYVYGEGEGSAPILFIVRPSRLGRQVLAALAGIATFFVLAIVFVVGGITIGSALQSDALGGALAVVGSVLAIAGTLYVAVRVSPKRHIYVYGDDTKTDLLLEILQDQKVAIIRATYTVVDPRDGTLAILEKNYLYNLFRKRWVAATPEKEPLIVAREDSMILSLLRRLFGPLLGLLRTNFVFQRPGTETIIGEFNRKMTLFDRYVLDLTADAGHELDRRVAVALGVLLDTGERR